MFSAISNLHKGSPVWECILRNDKAFAPALRVGLIAMSLTFVCAACGTGLSRGRAADLISEQQHLPRPQTITIAGSYLKRSWSKPVVGFGRVTICVGDNGDTYATVKERLTYWQSLGLITVGFRTNGGDCPAIWATVSLTEEGKKYRVGGSAGSNEVRVFNLSFGEVTGIQTNEQVKAARVDYVLKMTNVTPFGSNIVTGPVSKMATFAQFDDGWRIQPAAIEAASLQFRAIAPTAALEEASRAIAAAEAEEEAANSPLNEELGSIVRNGWWPEQKERVDALLARGASMKAQHNVSLFNAKKGLQHDPEAIEFLRQKGFRFDDPASDWLCLFGDTELIQTARYPTSIEWQSGREAFKLLLKYGASTTCAVPIGYTFVDGAIADPASSTSVALAGLAWLREQGVDLKSRFTIDDSWMPDAAERRTGKSLLGWLLHEVSKLDAAQKRAIQPLIEYFDKQGLAR